MPRCVADKSINRHVINGFSFPLGVYPVEPMTPAAGYSVAFEPADGDSDGDWEEWPDRYVYDIVVSADRLQPLCRTLFGLLPGRVYPILDVLGHDAYREIDPFVAYDLVGLDGFLDGIRLARDFLFEDGLCGFGALADDPFVYVFVDEHKILTVRVQADLRERVDRILAAFDLDQVEHPVGADGAGHEHRAVLHAPDQRTDLLDADEIVERLRDDWRLVLNVDPEQNTDDEGHDLGLTCWRCVVRDWPEEGDSRYAEVLLVAGCLRAATDLAMSALRDQPPAVAAQSGKAPPRASTDAGPAETKPRPDSPSAASDSGTGAQPSGAQPSSAQPTGAQPMPTDQTSNDDSESPPDGPTEAGQASDDEEEDDAGAEFEERVVIAADRLTSEEFLPLIRSGKRHGGPNPVLPGTEERIFSARWLE